MFPYFPTATILATILLSTTLQAQTTEYTAENLGEMEPDRIVLDGEVKPMSLGEVVMLAFEQNLDIRISRLDQEIDEQGIRLETGIYDPLLEADLLYGRTKEESNTLESTVDVSGNRSDLSVTRQNDLSATARLSQLLPTGASLYTEFTSSRSVAEDSRRISETRLNPYVSQRLSLGISQPLLKYFGPKSTNLGIRVAERQEQVSILLYQQQVLNQLAMVMSSYWDLVFAKENLEVQRSSLAASAELERVNKLRLDTGAAPKVDYLRAKADRASRQNDVINAKAQIIDAQDILLQQMNWREDAFTDWTFFIEPTDVPDNYDLEMTLEDDLAVTQAVSARPDFLATMELVEIAQLRKDVAKWNRLPEFNAIAEVGANGADDGNGRAFDDVEDADYVDYFVGAELRYPLLNRRARAEYQQRLLERDQADRQVERSELTIVTEVRAATRLIRTAQDRIEASMAQVEAAEESLTTEQKRLEVGSSTTFEVLDAQEDLVQAQLNLLNAKVAYQKGLIELYRAQGTLLDRIGSELNVEIEYEVVAGE